MATPQPGSVKQLEATPNSPMNVSPAQGVIVLPGQGQAASQAAHTGAPQPGVQSVQPAHAVVDTNPPAPSPVPAVSGTIVLIAAAGVAAYFLFFRGK